MKTITGVEYEDGQCVGIMVSGINGEQAPVYFERVRSGKWENNIRGDYCVVCNECGFGLPTESFAWMDCNRKSDDRESCHNIIDLANYCPNCGARMNRKDD